MIVGRGTHVIHGVVQLFSFLLVMMKGQISGGPPGMPYSRALKIDQNRQKPYLGLQYYAYYSYVGY
jgi:hypothetical protein